MKIKFQRTGGFAGIPVNVELDSANMSEESIQRLTGLVDKAFPFNPEKAEVLVDGCNYDLTIEGEGREPTELHVNDSQLTDALGELFEFILAQ